MRNLSFNLLHTSKRKDNSKLPILIESRYTSGYPQKDAGFSLVEVVAVVLMIGILAAIALPSWSAFVNQQQLNKANDAVLAAIQQAQTEAKKRKLSYSVSFATNSNNVLKVAVYPTADSSSTIPGDPNKSPPDSYWQSLGGDLQIAAGSILLGTNITTNPNQADSSINYAQQYISSNQSQTITFDYLGTLPNANFGEIATGETEPPGLKIVVALPAGNSTTASSVMRCVIIKNILGSPITAKDEQCDENQP